MSTDLNKSGIEDTYSYHHTVGTRRGRSIFGGPRGLFLRKHIGTGKKILDIGCRDGALTREYFKGNEVLGVDIDREALANVEKTLNIKTHYLDLNSDWHFEQKTFDVVVAGEVLEHLYYPSRVLERVIKVLNDDGMFIGSVPNAFSLMNRIRLFFGAKANTPLGDPTHINHFTRGELKKLLEEKFMQVSIEPLGKYVWLDRIFPGWFSFMFLFVAEKKRTLN